MKQTEYNPSLPSQFTAFARQPRITYSYYCEACGHETQHVYLWTEHGTEVYQCPLCKTTKHYRVR